MSYNKMYLKENAMVIKVRIVIVMVLNKRHLCYQMLFHINSKFNFFIGVDIVMCHALIYIK